VILVLGFLGFQFFQSGAGELTTGSNATSTDQTAAGQDILETVDKLKNVAITPELFSSDLFTNLKDFSVALTPEQQGRANPFASIGTGGSGNTSGTTGTGGKGTSASSGSSSTSGNRTGIPIKLPPQVGNEL